MKKIDYAIYPFAEDKSKCLRIDKDSMSIINDSTAHLEFLLEKTSWTL